MLTCEVAAPPSAGAPEQRTRDAGGGRHRCDRRRHRRAGGGRRSRSIGRRCRSARPCRRAQADPDLASGSLRPASAPPPRRRAAATQRGRREARKRGTPVPASDAREGEPHGRGATARRAAAVRQATLRAQVRRQAAADATASARRQGRRTAARAGRNGAGRPARKAIAAQRKSWIHPEAARGPPGTRRSGFALRQARRAERPAEEVDGRRAAPAHRQMAVFRARREIALAGGQAGPGRAAFASIARRPTQAAHPVKPGDVLTIKLDRRIIVCACVAAGRTPRAVRGGADALRGSVAAAAPKASGVARRNGRRCARRAAAARPRRNAARSTEVSRRRLTSCEQLPAVAGC